jgi:hypothetical protein
MVEPAHTDTTIQVQCTFCNGSQYIRQRHTAKPTLVPTAASPCQTPNQQQTVFLPTGACELDTSHLWCHNSSSSSSLCTANKQLRVQHQQWGLLAWLAEIRSSCSLLVSLLKAEGGQEGGR